MSSCAHNGMEDRLDRLAEDLAQAFDESGCSVERSCGEVTLVVPVAKMSDIALRLRDDEQFAFEELIDVCGVDYSAYGQSEWQTDAAPNSGFGRGVTSLGELELMESNRFAAVYHLLSITHNTRVRLRVFVDTEQPIVASMVPVWPSADWFEREAFDLYGILFDGHPDLRRILTDYGFIGHPFRKDFPLIGQVEMRYDPNLKRVIYEPVSIDPRTLVPRVTRDDNRYLNEDGAMQEAGDA
ncbi:MAG: NADH-quinone oxidoreductase subunit C [gamma proteobacterium symbiont of Ctena orbiculata]|nr:MAG: NADH-quinone oxidoreductase subunit C [gamma proteobacterium symbiont of Ctena orbiculata]PVV15532.1 MAG: NADH-quinone oxidoreductase subunit C [gamma proteobacterium symbiont of Ctena orbiculata]PVV21387.1 MAG: NADH-quinone oxidoreductase subunit C [gamma proteobacterium symbiont of Ctena orbiculata]